jgi:hypothetical protein
VSEEQFAIWLTLNAKLNICINLAVWFAKTIVNGWLARDMCMFTLHDVCLETMTCRREANQQYWAKSELAVYSCRLHSKPQN